LRLFPVVVCVDAELEESSVGDVEQVETDIVQQSMILTIRITAEDGVQLGARERQVRSKLQQFVQEELGPDVELIGARKQNSIGSYFVCKTLTALQRLYQMYLSGRLQTFLEELFTLLLDNGQRIRIKNLVWSRADYDNCVKFFCKLSGMP
jgi:hypothetical protein